MADVVLGDNPSDEEITQACLVMRGGGSVGGELESDGADWARTIARYVNGFGPDPTDRFGVMRYERVTAVLGKDV